MLLSPQEEILIVQAIQKNESQSKGEIRVHVDSHLIGDCLEKAKKVFTDIDMDKTSLRNGVLIYISKNKKKLCIIGDVGIKKQLPDNYWDHLVKSTLSYFKLKQYCNGIIYAINEVGKQLAIYFPSDSNNRKKNELPNEISK